MGNVTGRMLNGLVFPGRVRVGVFFAVVVAASIYLATTALKQHRPLVPVMHDEFSYLLQARMMAHGRLYEPQHPLADFFESFHILVKPVYGSIYFPGTAVFYVPAIWLNCSPWVLTVAVFGLIAGMSYLVAAELSDDRVGLIVVLLLLATPLFRSYSVYVLGQGPASLLGLLMIWSWLRWRPNKGLAWALAIGVWAGWAAITRPVDALAFAAPIGLAMFVECWRAPGKVRVVTAGVILAGASPFLLLQLHFNRAVTGSFAKSPYVLYLEQNQPGTVFGFGTVESGVRPESALPQKQVYFDKLGPLMSDHHWGHLASMVGERLAGFVLSVVSSGVFLPLAMVGLAVSLLNPDWRLRTVFAIPVLFFALYLLNPILLQHYTLPLVPLAAVAVVIGARAVALLFRSESRRMIVGSVLMGGVVVLCVAALPEVKGTKSDDLARCGEIVEINRVFREQVKAPAVVFFRYTPRADCNQEPVYNIDACVPDDAAVVRVQDLGARNREVGRYYSERQPRRHFYLYDRGDHTLHDLGTGADVAGGR